MRGPFRPGLLEPTGQGLQRLGVLSVAAYWRWEAEFNALIKV